MHYLRPAQTIGDCIVRAVDENHMYQSHSYQQRDDTEEHDLVFPEQPLCSYPSSKHTYEDGGKGEDGAPPRDEEGGIDIISRLVGWRKLVVDGALL